MTGTVQQAKNQVRSNVRLALASMSDAERRNASETICGRVSGMREFQIARTIMLYLPMPGEVDVTPLVNHALHEGRTICVPGVDWERRELRPIQLQSLAANSFRIGRHGLRVPVGDREIQLNTLDMVIVPGMAFDADGNRLGRNAGFYDRFLSRLNGGTVTLGVAFQRQIVDKVPVEPHDIAVDLVATESQMLTRPTTE